MKAMILAAGLGTRLRPLTNFTPKALVPVVNKPMIGRTIEYLKQFGIRQIVVNAHHHSEKILKYLDSGRPFGVEIDVRVESRILGTGGGIKNTRDFWDVEPFVVINSDVLTDINLNGAYEYHKTSKGMATLVLHDCDPFNQIQIDNDRHIMDIATKEGPGRLAFTGIHIMEPELLSHIPGSGFSDIIDCYRKLLQSGIRISAFFVEGHYWRDIGNTESYILANKDILEKDKKAFSLGLNTFMCPSVRLSEWAVIGDHVVLEQGVEIKRSIIWDHVRVQKGYRIIDSIVRSGKEVGRNLKGQIE
jgi:mannose-1-phosphate guanylyltransferase